MDPLTTSENVYRRLVAFAREPAPALRAWDGTRWGSVDAGATIVLRHPGALRALLMPPSDLVAGEAYIQDDVDIEGDILIALDFASRLQPLARTPLKAMRVMRLLRRLPRVRDAAGPNRPRFHGRRHTKRRDRSAVTHHYDTGNDFFEEFLDEDLVYSCAYFLSPSESLAVAQRRKLDVVCRKLELAPGVRFLDVGCGWGALVTHAAREYGVHATGVTLSERQAALARARAESAGVGDRVSILPVDYREVTGEFDAIASVGMFEHVGGRQLGTYFQHLAGLLAPTGRLLNHGITNRDRSGGRRTATFVNTYVFPDGELVPVEEVIGAAEPAGLEVRDLESLRWSYGLTLRHWVANLELNREAAVAASDEATYRIWRLYMGGSVLAFESAAISVYQMLLAKPDHPWRFGRRHLLAADDGARR
jgi:cyclopropane-fatty-acyl-phospholipid synthase